MTEYTIQETKGFTETRRFATDDEICEQFPHHVIFSAEGLARADGKTPLTIRLQVVSLPLSDDTRRSIHQACRITVVSDEGAFTVETNEKGYGEFECAFAAAGAYTFTTDGVIFSQGITIEAV